MIEEINNNLKIRCPCLGLFSLENIVQHQKSIKHRRFTGEIPKKISLSNSTRTRIWYDNLPPDIKLTYMLIASEK